MFYQWAVIVIRSLKLILYAIIGTTTTTNRKQNAVFTFLVLELFSAIQVSEKKTLISYFPINISIYSIFITNVVPTLIKFSFWPNYDRVRISNSTFFTLR